MTEQEWIKELKTYKTPRQVALECIEGIEDHVGGSGKCTKGHSQTVATQSAGKRGLPPFHEELTICDRGTRGCNLSHNDGQMIRFVQLGFERIVELAK